LVDLGERQFLTQPVALPFVALGVDRLLEEERVIEAVQLLLNQLDALLLLDRPVLQQRRYNVATDSRPCFELSQE
jgi:hypothetical protein